MPPNSSLSRALLRSTTVRSGYRTHLAGFDGGAVSAKVPDQLIAQKLLDQRSRGTQSQHGFGREGIGPLLTVSAARSIVGNF